MQVSPSFVARRLGSLRTERFSRAAGLAYAPSMARDEPLEPAISDAPNARLFTPDGARDVSSWVGRRLGAYEPLLEIARGGMGAVFAARAHEAGAVG